MIKDIIKPVLHMKVMGKHWSSTSLLNNKLEKLQSKHHEIVFKNSQDEWCVPDEYSWEEFDETSTFVEFENIIRQTNAQYLHANNVYNFANHNMNLKMIGR